MERNIINILLKLLVLIVSLKDYVEIRRFLKRKPIMFIHLHLYLLELLMVLK